MMNLTPLRWPDSSLIRRLKPKRLLASFFLIGPLSVRASTQLLVPAYFDPSTSADWNTLTSSVSTAVPITAIMNPNSGPVGKIADPSYTAAINSLETAGGKVIAYVHTQGGAISLTTVKNQIKTYQTEYPTLNGIFIDEMSTDPSELSYYKSLYTYIKGRNANWEVVGNPGTYTDQSYLSPTPAAADVLMTFENSTPYSTYTPSSWQSSFSASSFANIGYAETDAATMQSNVSLSAVDRAASVYFTDLSGANPYSALPSYWSQEVAAVRAVNTTKAQYIAAGSGDYNTAANWSLPIPNAVGAEADFLSAIAANHTVYSDSAITVGKIIFNNSNSYVLAGAGSLTLQTSTGSASIDAQAATQKITLPITIASNTVFTAESGATLVIDAPVTVNSGQTLTESGVGNVTFLSTVTVQSGGTAALAAGLSVQSIVLAPGSHASLVSSGTVASQVDSLSIASGSLLNLNGTDLIVHNGDLSTITSQIKSGRNMTDGIGSSASASGLISLGVISNISSIYHSFDGTAVTSSDILIKSTTAGDANLDGVVNSADYDLLNTGYIGDLTGWYNGDFNYDGIVNGADYALIDNAYNSSNQTGVAAIFAQTTSEIATQVPEPAALSALMAVIAPLCIGRRRRNL